MNINYLYSNFTIFIKNVSIKRNFIVDKKIRLNRRIFSNYFYLAYSITRVSRITLTLISPGYCNSFSILRAISLARL